MVFINLQAGLVTSRVGQCVSHVHLLCSHVGTHAIQPSQTLSSLRARARARSGLTPPIASPCPAPSSEQIFRKYFLTCPWFRQPQLEQFWKPEGLERPLWWPARWSHRGHQRGRGKHRNTMSLLHSESPYCCWCHQAAHDLLSRDRREPVRADMMGVSWGQKSCHSRTLQTIWTLWKLDNLRAQSLQVYIREVVRRKHVALLTEDNAQVWRNWAVAEFLEGFLDLGLQSHIKRSVCFLYSHSWDNYLVIKKKRLKRRNNARLVLPTSQAVIPRASYETPGCPLVSGSLSINWVPDPWSPQRASWGSNEVTSEQSFDKEPKHGFSLKSGELLLH